MHLQDDAGTIGAIQVLSDANDAELARAIETALRRRPAQLSELSSALLALTCRWPAEMAEAHGVLSEALCS